MLRDLLFSSRLRTASSPSASRDRRVGAHTVWLLAVLTAFSTATGPVGAAGVLEVEFNAGYNLVVDSNVCSPSTYAPRVATMGVAFCNRGDAPLTGVVASIGDFATKTPGIYPVRDSATGAADIAVTSPCLADTGTYSFTHIGDLVDATRVIGDLGVGQCSWQYWAVTYPRRSNPDTGSGGCSPGQVPVWCSTNDPNDDLWLEFDVWAESAEGPAVDDTWRMTHRNEISAVANKIFPNDGTWFNEPSQCEPGQTVTTNGVNYRLGVVNQGFDNDGDGIPDYNAWLQPIGSADAWNPACFRLVKTSGQLQIGRTGSWNPADSPDFCSFDAGTDYCDFVDQLYYTNLGANNGVRGLVYYEFLCLGGACAVPLTPYQEAASGFDNEKFAGDYGTFIGELEVVPPSIVLDKTVEDASMNGYAAEGEVLTYEISLENTGANDLGRPDLNVPLLVRDSIPPDTTYVAGTAAESFACCTTDIFYSFDDGTSWTAIEPAPANVTDIMWRFNEQFPSGASGFVTFDVTVDTPYTGTPVILNTGESAFGDSPPWDDDTVGIPIQGNNVIGDRVFRDDGGGNYRSADSNNGVLDGSEVGIDGATVHLWWDVNGDGVLDAGDIEVATATTATVGPNAGVYTFPTVADGDWLVTMSQDDLPGSVPDGYRLTTDAVVAVTDLGIGTTSTVSFLDADFGFGPTLVIDKALSPISQCGENSRVSYEITLSNVLGADEQCTYRADSEAVSSPTGCSKLFSNEAAAVGHPDGSFATDDFGGALDCLQLDGYSDIDPNTPGTITRVEVLARMYADPATMPNDRVSLALVENGTVIATQQMAQSGSPAPLNLTLADIRGTASAADTVVWDVTSLRGSWSFADFTNPAVALELGVRTQKQGADDGWDLHVDSLTFRVTTDRLCGAPGTDLSRVGFEDQFDQSFGVTFAGSRFCGADTDADTRVCGDADDVFLTPNSQFSCTGVTASCEYANTRVLHWSDVGPLLAGQSKTFRVDLAVPNGTAGSTLADTAKSCGAGQIDRVNIFDGLLDVNGSGAPVDGADDGFVDGIPVIDGFVDLDGDGIANETNGDDDGIFSGLVIDDGYVDVDGDGVLGPADPVDDDRAAPNACVNTYFDGSASNNDEDELACVLQDTWAIGDFVWSDANSNGVQNVGEAGIPGVTVELWLDNARTLTQVRIDNGYVDVNGNGVPNEGADDGIVSGFAVQNGLFDLDGDGLFGETDGTDDGTVDGLSVVNGGVNVDGDNKLFETNGHDDRAPDPGTPDVLLRTTTTDGAGGYLFSGLVDSAAGEQYFVIVDPATIPDPTPNQTFDRDGTLDHQTNVTLAGADILNADFGYNVNNLIFGNVYYDWAANSIRDGADYGLGNGSTLVRVRLYNCNAGGCQNGGGDDTLVQTVFTDADGDFVFPNLANGTFQVVVDTTTLPGAAWTQTQDPGGAAGDSASGPLVLTGGTIPPSQNFGYFQATPGSTIGDTLYTDWDGDGVQDAGEGGIAGVRLRVYRDDGDGIFDPFTDTQHGTAITNATGNYLFSQPFDCLTDTNGNGDPCGDGDDVALAAAFPAGTWWVQVDETDRDLPSAYAQTGDPDQPGATCTVCDALGTAVTDGTVATDLTEDFGYQPMGSASIGDYVWRDTDADGIQDATESGLPGITVTLYVETDGSPGLTGGDAQVATTVTDVDGSYLFEFLYGDPSVTYYVDVDQNDPQVPTDGGDDFDVSTTGDNNPYVLTSTCSSTGQPGTCSGSDAITVVLASNTAAFTAADFGFGPGAVIGDTIFFDLNGDGSYNPASEAGIPGVVVELRDGVCDPLPAPNDCPTDTTDANGEYIFTGLSSGSYTVVVDPLNASAAIAAATPTYDPDEAGVCVTCDEQTSRTLIPGQVDLSADFGYRPSGYIGDTIWEDRDLPGDAVFDVGEAGIGGIDVTIVDCGANTVCGDGDDGATRNVTTTTDADGLWFFDVSAFAAGNYRVTVDTTDLDPTSTWNQTADPDEAGVCTVCNSRIDITLNASGTVTSPAGVGNLDLDFAYERVAAPRLTIDKDTSTPDVAAGGQAVWTIIVRNTGTATATLVDVADLLPTGSGTCSGPGGRCFLLADSDPDTGGCQEAVYALSAGVTPQDPTTLTTRPTCGAFNLLWEFFTIPPQDFVRITFTVAVDTGTSIGTYDNTASSFYDSDGNASQDTLIDDVGTTAQDADTPQGQDPEADEDVTIRALPLLAVTKTCTLNDGDADNLGDAGETITFSIDVQNVGTADATIFAINDAVPQGTTYNAASANIDTLPDWTNIIVYRDDFETGSSGHPSDGAFPSGDDTTPTTSSWSNDWTSGLTAIDLGDTSLHIETNENPSRQVVTNTPTAPERATFSFRYRRSGFEDTDTITVTACGATVITIDGTTDGGTGDVAPFTDSAYITRSFRLTTVTNPCTIQFTPNNLGASTDFYIDNVSFDRRDRVVTSATADPPPLLVPAADNRELLVGETMTVSFDVTIDTPLPNGQNRIFNEVFVEAEELADPITDSCQVPLDVNPALLGSIAGTVYRDNDENGVQGGGDPGIENVAVELWADDGDGLFDPNTDTQVGNATLTRSDGSYLFDDLFAGPYFVVVDGTTLPVSHVQSGDPDDGSPPCTGTSTCDGRGDLIGPFSSGPPPSGELQTNEDRTGVDFGYFPEITPLPVTLSSFSAEETGDGIRFRWTTDTETGNLGFYLYAAVDGEWELVDRDLIVSKAIDSVMPLDYEVEIPGLEADRFLLVDLDVRGKGRFHGPFRLGRTAVSDAPEVQAIPWAEIRAEHEEKTAARRSAFSALRRSMARPAARLLVDENRPYRIGFEQLVAAGIDFTGVPLDQLALTDRNGPVPFRVLGATGADFGPGAALEFVGRESTSEYSRSWPLTLRVGEGGPRIGAAPRSLPYGIPDRFYDHSVRIERDNAYSAASPNGDPWYDRWLISQGSPVAATREIVLEGITQRGEAPRLDLGLWGVTDFPEAPDHHVVVRFNGEIVLDERFDGHVVFERSIELPFELLREGANTLRVELPGDVPAAADVVALDWYRVSHPRMLRARDGRLSFRAPAEVRSLAVDGFDSTDLTVYREVDGQVEWLSDAHVYADAGSMAVTFSADPGATYHVAAAGAFATPGVEAAPVREELFEGDAEYLIVTHPDFRAGVEELAEHRRSGGLSVRVVDVEQIYERYTGGMRDPEAIRSYVAEAAEQSEVRFVLLVGGDTYDYRDRLGFGSLSFVPSLYTATGVLITHAPADPLYGDLDRDGVPEIAVGRLPVRTGDELAVVVQKIRDYETKDYQKTFLSATDADDLTQGISFQAAAAALTGTLAPGWSVTDADIEELGVPAARQKILDEINAGAAYTQYFGHSSYGIWSFSPEGRLLQLSDLQYLTNSGRPTVVGQWGCWNTYYVLPNAQTFGHQLLVTGDRGAAAVLGASTLTDSQSDSALGEHFVPLLTSPGWTIGEALVEAKQRLAAARPGVGHDVQVGWTILGDPALRIDVAPPTDCVGDPAYGDSDGDGACDDIDLCLGDDAFGDGDGDGICDDLDACPGGPDGADQDGDGVCDSLDVCPGASDGEDADDDGVPDGCDLCFGDDALGDEDGDGVCGTAVPPGGLFEDGFETGDTRAWSRRH